MLRNIKRTLIISAASLGAFIIALNSIAKVGYASPQQISQLPPEEKKIVLVMEERAQTVAEMGVEGIELKRFRKEIESIMDEANNAYQYVIYAKNELQPTMNDKGIFHSSSYDEAEEYIIKASKRFEKLKERILNLKGGVFKERLEFSFFVKNLNVAAERLVMLDRLDTNSRVEGYMHNFKWDEAIKDVERFKQRVIRMKEFVDKNEYSEWADGEIRRIKNSEAWYHYETVLTHAKDAVQHSNDLQSMNEVIKDVTRASNLVKKQKSFMALNVNPYIVLGEMNQIIGKAYAKKAEILIIRAETHQSINDLFLARMDAREAIKSGNKDAMKLLEEINEKIKLYKNTRFIR